MQTTLNLILLVQVLILAAILTPAEKREEFRSWLFWSAVIAALAFYVGPFVFGLVGWGYEVAGAKRIAITLIVTFFVVALLLGWRHDRRETAKIKAGDDEAFNRRVDRLIQDRNYTRERAIAVVQRLKERQ